jgi:hypothetical protein
MMGKKISGFKLDSLQRMQYTKDAHNMTFLHHIERLVRLGFLASIDFNPKFPYAKRQLIVSQA